MSETIKMIYVDDSATETVKFEKVMEAFPEVIITGCFSEAEAAYKFCSKNKPDLVLLDIIMPEKNGLWLADQLNEIDIPFGFISSSDSFGYDAFKLSALHYLPRPISMTSVKELLERYKIYSAKNKIEKNDEKIATQRVDLPKRIYINTQKQILVFNLTDILYLKAEGSYTNIHLLNGKVIVSGKNLKSYSQQVLLNPDFIKIHRSYIINQSHLTSINKTKDGMIFLFNNNDKISVASFNRTDWLDK